MGVQIDNLFSGLMTGRPGVNHPDVIKSRVSSPKANGKLPAILVSQNLGPVGCITNRFLIS